MGILFKYGQRRRCNRKGRRINIDHDVITDPTTKGVYVEKGTDGSIIAKTCRVCGEYIPLEDLAPDNAGFVGRNAVCISCTKKLKRKWQDLTAVELKSLVDEEGLTDEAIGVRFGIGAKAVRKRRYVCGVK